MRPYLTDGRWDIEWLDIAAVIAHIEEVAEQFGERGRESFSVTREEMETSILAIVKAEHERNRWLPTRDGAIGSSDQAKLLAGALRPPGRLTPSGLRHAVGEHFLPLDFPDATYPDVLGVLLERARLVNRIIESTLGGSSDTPVETEYICCGPRSETSTPATGHPAELPNDGVSSAGAIVSQLAHEFDGAEPTSNEQGFTEDELDDGGMGKPALAALADSVAVLSVADGIGKAAGWRDNLARKMRRNGIVLVKSSRPITGLLGLS